MNLPVLSPVVRNVPLDKIVSDKLFLDLYDKKFDGYIYLTIDGKYGFEEAILILSKGKIEGTIYLIEGHDIELMGKDAIGFCLNSFGAKKGILNIFALTDDQIKLVLLFNEKIKHSFAIKTSKNISILKDAKYNELLLDELFKDRIKKEKTTKEILDDFNLDDLLRE